MSEEILRALMQLFALITKQDGGSGDKEIAYVEAFLMQQIGVESAQEYLALYRETADTQEQKISEEPKLTSVLDSVRVLKLCKQISKTINQRQKIVVLVRILELVHAEYKLSEQRMGIVRTVSDIFRISKEEYESILLFVSGDSAEDSEDENLLLVAKEDNADRHICLAGLDAPAVFLRVPSVELYFLKSMGNMEAFLNGLSIRRNQIYLFASGSTLRFPLGKPVLYSDISARFLAGRQSGTISLKVSDLTYSFPGGSKGLSNISFSAHQGNLVGIMGSSGSGKTTLMNALSGINRPSSGSVKINGLDLHEDAERLKGVSGLVPQDDLLIEELSVKDNLSFNAKFCFRKLSGEEIRQKVDETMGSLGLLDKQDLRVGSVMNKTISGGERKRLNIALELIREPSILFLDEPTSGLSSRDSEKVMDLLREQTLSGKLVFVVIHQPSSELFKMFDQVLILDKGGHMVYFGNPVEAVMHFKQADRQVNAGVGECPVCGNVNPEQIFNIIESMKVDEYGNYTDQRKVSPLGWKELFNDSREMEAPSSPSGNLPLQKLDVPGWMRQVSIYLRRDIKAKINNTQYLLMMLLVSPVLGFILSYIIRYKADPASDLYIFRENENIPIYIFMALIVVLFLGLIVSAEEIFRDRKILKREQFMQLSRSSYLMAKISTLVVISAIQALAFVLVANGILEIRKMTFAYWLALFSTAVCANMIGLIISSAFSSAVGIYIVIPLIMIPMMVLSGAMFTFDKLNRKITVVDRVPLIAEAMPTRWSYEALMVEQFKANEFEKTFYEREKQISIYNFKSAYLIPELEERLFACKSELTEHGSISNSAPALEVLRNEFLKAAHLVKDIRFRPAELNASTFNEATLEKCTQFLALLKAHYLDHFSLANRQKERMLAKIMKEKKALYFSMLDRYHNESVADQVKNIYEKNQIIEHKGELVQQIDPVFRDPEPGPWPGFRSHFYAPRKFFAGRYVSTYDFNIGFIWALTILGYFILYFDLLGKLLRSKIWKKKSS